jgi:hypothetical protein
MSDAEIADKASQIGWVLEHRHKGVVPWSKAFLKELLVSPFPREFAPGSGRGTIVAPDGERIEGQHVAAWSWELWHRMDETRALNTKGTRGRAPCGRSLHHQLRHGAIAGYYSSYICQATNGGYDCAIRTSPLKTGERGTRGYRGVRSRMLEEEFASLVLDWELPDDWRAQIAAEVNRTLDDGKRDEVMQWRNSPQEERKRVLFQHRNGVITDDEMLDETAR